MLSMMATSLKTEIRETVRTHDHERIKHWVENRGGTPSVVDGTWDGKRGELRIDFGESNEILSEITWDDFFGMFEEGNLDLVYKKNNDSSQHRFDERE